MTDIPFLTRASDDSPALLDDTAGNWISYRDLAGEALDWARRVKGQRGLVLLLVQNDIPSVAAFLGCLTAGHAVALFDPRLSVETRADLETRYRPTWIVDADTGDIAHPDGDGPLHPDLSVLLSTSGSTGSPKLVRLTQAALFANACGIADVLDIRSDDVAAGYLPLHYSYGLTVLTSHLVRGARIRLTQKGLMDREFWPGLREAGVTHMPGVPFHYQIMLRLGLQRLGLSRLRCMTQAGGLLDTASRTKVHAYMDAKGGHFYVLYGQTEAAPRMTTLQHAEFNDAPASVGTPLPGCRIDILEPDLNGQGEVIFQGPNVMMGYADNRDDLAKGDETNGRLHTGDIGFLDNAGRLTLTGRVKRMGKVYGLRVSLDEVETLVGEFGSAAVIQSGEVLTIFAATSGSSADDAALIRAIQDKLLDRFTLPLASYRFKIVSEIPRTERGKTDYAQLEAHPDE